MNITEFDGMTIVNEDTVSRFVVIKSIDDYKKICQHDGIVPFACFRAHEVTESEKRRLQADANESKYSGVPMTAEDRIMTQITHLRQNTFSEIELAHTCGVGSCRTEKGIIRRIKYGKGNLSKRGLMKAWQDRNTKVSCSLSDLPPSIPSRVSYNDDGISLHVYNGNNTYDISWWQIEPTAECINGWVRHLGHKTWADCILIADFVELVSMKYGIGDVR